MGNMPLAIVIIIAGRITAGPLASAVETKPPHHTVTVTGAVGLYCLAHVATLLLSVSRD